MKTEMKESKKLTKHVSCKCKCKLDSGKCNPNQKWNNDNCRCECKNPKKHMRIIVGILAHIFVRTVGI